MTLLPIYSGPRLFVADTHENIPSVMPSNLAYIPAASVHPLSLLRAKYEGRKNIWGCNHFFHSSNRRRPLSRVLVFRPAFVQNVRTVFWYFLRAFTHLWNFCSFWKYFWHHSNLWLLFCSTLGSAWSFCNFFGKQSSVSVVYNFYFCRVTNNFQCFLSHTCVQSAWMQ